MSVQVSCHECDGDGVVGSHTHNPDTERVAADPFIKCDRCDGEGVERYPMGYVYDDHDCSLCGGAGKVAPCPNSDGSGIGSGGRPSGVAGLGMTHDEFRELVRARVQAMVADA